jgi:hypothetical protein
LEHVLAAHESRDQVALHHLLLAERAKEVQAGRPGQIDPAAVAYQHAVRILDGLYKESVRQSTADVKGVGCVVLFAPLMGLGRVQLSSMQPAFLGFLRFHNEATTALHQRMASSLQELHGEAAAQALTAQTSELLAFAGGQPRLGKH